MTFEVASTKKYEKDVSIAKKRGLPIDKLVEVVGKLASGETLPPALKDHPLKGEFRGKRECHINPDWLLLDSPQMYRQTSPKDNPLQNSHAGSTINQLHSDSPTVDNQPSRAATDDLFSAIAASKPSQQAATQTIKQKPLQATTPNSPRITDTQNRTELGQSSSDKDKLYTSDNPTNSNTHEPKIVRIIVCMDDGTCENYSARMR